MIELDPQVLRRIRDRLLELGGRPSILLIRPGQDDQDEDPFGGDEEAEARFGALFEAMFLMIVADGTVADAELEVLRGATRILTDNAIRTAHITKMFKECKQRLQEGRPARLKAIAEILGEERALAESAFSLASAVAFADDVIDDSENVLVNDLAEALDIDAERAGELLEELREGPRIQAERDDP